MDNNENIIELIKEEIKLLKPFEEDNSLKETIFFLLSEIFEESDIIRDLCLDLMVYCKGSETSSFAYFSKQEILEHIKNLK